MRYTFGIAFIFVVFACGDSKSDFKGEGQQGKQAYSSDAKPAPTPAPIPSPVPPKPKTSPVPDRAVKVGSFQAWAEPKDPAPFETYAIVVKVTLPANQVAGYEATDLRGQVTGTDGFVKRFGSAAGVGNEFERLSDGALIRIFIPGGGNIVEDSIEVGSFILNEQAALSIVF